MRTEVGIIGAGPAGLLLGHLLAREGVDSVIVEAKSRKYIEERIRAGVLEHDVARLLVETGVGERLLREGLVHHGIELRFAGRRQRIDFADLTGRTVTVYGQHEVVKDLVAARLAAGGPILFEVDDVTVEDLDDAPRLKGTQAGRPVEFRCDIVAGCDGFHGVSRGLIPADRLTLYERSYPFAWLGILAETPPPSDELIYARHEHGFALASMRAPTVSRLYLQCEPDEDLARWPDHRIWDELHTRFAVAGKVRLVEGPILQRGVTAMRSFVAEPMRHGRLVLAGDAAHIVPPTGAKGMNLAVADVTVLARALVALLKQGRSEALDAYSETCLRRVWLAQRFSWWMTSLLHRFPGESRFDARRQLAELDYLAGSRAAQQALAENYVGLPLP